MRIDEGQLTVEGPTRLAHGEFVGPNGELASYALAWDESAEEAVGRITVGIGAGNPGGGTFHARMFDRGEDYGMTLVDEPLCEVPQGGPHLTAEQARAHEDVEFIWFVADTVMARDRRAWWLRRWLERTTAIMTLPVFERTEPVLYVSHEADDGLWQLIGSSAAVPADGRIAHLAHSVEHDLTLLDVLDLQPGEWAERDGPDQPWTRPATR